MQSRTPDCLSKWHFLPPSYLNQKSTVFLDLSHADSRRLGSLLEFNSKMSPTLSSSLRCHSGSAISRLSLELRKWFPNGSLCFLLCPFPNSSFSTAVRVILKKHKLDHVTPWLKIIHGFPLDWGPTPQSLSEKVYKFIQALCHVCFPVNSHSLSYTVAQLHGPYNRFANVTRAFLPVDYNFTARVCCLKCFSLMFWTLNLNHSVISCSTPLFSIMTLTKICNHILAICLFV